MNKQINIINVPKEANYTGYLWMSDSKDPIQDLTIILKKLSGITDKDNPFVIEGQLYAEKERKSYSIRYVDGKHIVVEYDLANIPSDWVSDEEEDVKKFIPNRLDRVSKVVFRRYWKPEPDELCKGMDVLVPAAYVFVGFKFSNNKKEEK